VRILAKIARQQRLLNRALLIAILALVLAVPPTVLRKHQAVDSNPFGTCPPP
jgi:hypothetical protein